ncbi:MAG: DUF4115 domain-containing protein [Oculatellaceae cyanobacterium Prado106]|jgi:cytoskeletal protein RodZ|nr:DUF4115 domain-containing protein [Oculatellaceae cyanobacterium Prado106]
MVTLDGEQLEQLKTIGAYLSQVRQEQSKSLEEISAKTYIPLRILRAIESAQEQILPEPVFVQGFIRRYGDALGMNGQELSKKFPLNNNPVPSAPIATEVRPSYSTASASSHSASSHAASPTSSSSASTSSADAEPVRTASRFSPSPKWESRESMELPVSRPPYLLMVGVGAIALAALFFGIIQPGLQRQPSTAQVTAPAAPPAPPAAPPAPAVAPASPVTASPVTASPVTSPATATSPSSNSPASSTAASSPSTPASPAAGNQPVNVEVSLTGESWLMVTVDGKVAFEGILEQGAKQSWSGKEQILVDSGNAGAVSVSLNNGPAQTLGSLGAVVGKTFTAKGTQ